MNTQALIKNHPKSPQKQPNKPIMLKKPPFCRIFGVQVHFGNPSAIKNYIFQAQKYNKQCHINTPNPEQIILAQKNNSFLQALNNSDINICDGAGLVWALKRKLKNQSKKNSVQRVAGSDFMLELVKASAEKGKKVFLLGGRNNTAQKSAQRLKKEFPSLQISAFSGSHDIARESVHENNAIIKKINAFSPDFLFVAYGAPYQELWITQNLKKLKVKTAMSVGGSLDYIAGNKKRAPVFLRNLGLEWFFRLLQEPSRLIRQIKGAVFFLKVLIRPDLC